MKRYDVDELIESIHQCMSERADYVIENFDRKALLSSVLSEMKDAPDQRLYGLTRDDVEKILSAWNYVTDEDGKYIVHGTEHDYDGMRRAADYPIGSEPEIASASATWVDGENRPAGLMPYDFDYDTPEDDDEGDIRKTKVYEAEDVANSQIYDPDAIEQVFAHAVAHGADTELVLVDGSSIFIDPHSAQAILNASKIGIMMHHVRDLEDFSIFVKSIYPEAGDIIDDYDDLSESFFDIMDGKLIDALNEAINHHKVYGKMAIVDRVRGGKIQMRKKKSDVAGYKLVDGQIKRMSPAEIRKRKRGARISARKRKGKLAQILRKRKISLRKRANRFGG